MELTRANGAAAATLLQAVQQRRMRDLQLFGQSQQDHVLAGAVAGKVIKLPRDGGLGGCPQCLGQVLPGPQQEAGVIVVAPVLLGALGRQGLEGHRRALGCTADAALHAHM